MDIKSGSKVLIHGPSGRGKTTLLHLFAGLHLAAEGTVRVGGISLGAINDSARARLRRENIGIVFQRLNLMDHLSALENILLGIPPNFDKKRAIESSRNALAALGLASSADTRAGVLSLGEQQRVAVARVIAAKPKLVLADEPTSSLDHLNAEKVMMGLFEGAQLGTLIVVSHDERIKKYFPKIVDFNELVQ